MLQGYYSAASGMSGALQNQDVLAQNLAHAPVPGYRRQGQIFSAFVKPQNAPASEEQDHPLHGSQVSRIASVFAPGPYQHTGNPLECAIQGNGFFVLDGPNGPLYTRNGQFQVNANSQLVSPGGYPVSGADGALTIPQDAAHLIIGLDGTVTAGNTTIGQLKLASFADPSQLERAGTTLFQAPTNVAPQAFTGSIRQGYREGSNVQVVQEMVQMIAGMRQYEAAAKSLRSLSDAMQQRINGQM
ncbi:MAG TPA: flagellar basal-body rod protein FlgF [Gemmataceae bacterium]|nr:flagellar basal-body rod protein FlgF [Gemmataceae bacterium]